MKRAGQIALMPFPHEEGRLEAKQEMARNLIKLGVRSDEQIAEATGLTQADVQALRGEANH